MEDLRNHLFAQLERLSDDDKPPSAEELARAKMVSEVAKTLIDSARVEVEFLEMRANSPRLQQGVRSDFLEGAKPMPVPSMTGSDRNP